MTKEKLNWREDLIYTFGIGILIYLVLSGWKGMLAAGALILWMALMDRADKKADQNDSQPEKKENLPDNVIEFRAS
ncbi:hypothetical protein [Anaerolentibacter hominis]|uniref:hypothetical protein n=1 Tax=Anaerolentibacter hominis TaxID=3079009 RepID=UPI0031B87C33